MLTPSLQEQPWNCWALSTACLPLPGCHESFTRHHAIQQRNWKDIFSNCHQMFDSLTYNYYIVAHRTLQFSWMCLHLFLLLIVICFQIWKRIWASWTHCWQDTLAKPAKQRVWSGFLYTPTSSWYVLCVWYSCVSFHVNLENLF